MNIPANRKGLAFASPFLLVEVTPEEILVVAEQQLQVRIRRSKVGELAHQT